MPTFSQLFRLHGGYQSVDELLIPGGRIYEQRGYLNTKRFRAISC
ncbi:MAG: hypothetical protein ACLRPQ_03535 [Streptococcus sp.]